MQTINSTKEELKRELKKYTSTLDNYIIEYLRSLIELDFSVLREYLSTNDKTILTDLSIYRKITTYNIYNRTIGILSNTDYPINIYHNKQEHNLIITTNNNNEIIPIFNFKYNKYSNTNRRIGTIDIYKTEEKPEIIDKELDRIMSILEKLYDTPIPLIENPNSNLISSYWLFKHNENIKYFETLFTKLDNYQKNPSKELAQISQYYNAILLKEFDLTHKDFYDESQTFSNKSINLTHKRIKKLPEAEITNNINYV